MYMYVYILTLNAIRLYLLDLIMGHNGLVICVHVCRGVDNGAAGTAAAAPIIWLVVVIQK